MNEIEKTLASYFKGVDADIDVVMAGRIPYLDIQYTDFKPTAAVRSEVAALVPRAEWTRLERTYSRQRIVEELWRMYREDTMMLIQEGDDLFRSTVLPIYVQERMRDRKFTQE